MNKKNANYFSFGFDTEGIAYEKRRLETWIFVFPIVLLFSFWAKLKKTFFRRFHKCEPAVNSMWVDGLGYCWRQITAGNGSWKALEILYNLENYLPRNSTKIGKFLDQCYSKNTNNPKSVRNRLKLAKRLISEMIHSFGKPEELRILSLACGSAQALIETIAENGDKNIKALLVDIDPEALEYATNLAQKHGVSDKVETMQRNAMMVAKIARDFKPHIVEMMGLLDYIPDSNATALIQRIKDGLPEGGYFATCNIHKNMEVPIVRHILNWEMIYRTPLKIGILIAGGGFENYEIFTEPLGIHSIVVAKKNK